MTRIVKKWIPGSQRSTAMTAFCLQVRSLPNFWLTNPATSTFVLQIHTVPLWNCNLICDGSKSTDQIPYCTFISLLREKQFLHQSGSICIKESNPCRKFSECEIANLTALTAVWKQFGRRCKGSVRGLLCCKLVNFRLFWSFGRNCRFRGHDQDSCQACPRRCCCNIPASQYCVYAIYIRLVGMEASSAVLFQKPVRQLAIPCRRLNRNANSWIYFLRYVFDTLGNVPMRTRS